MHLTERILIAVLFGLGLGASVSAQAPCEGEDEWGTPYTARAENGVSRFVWGVHWPPVDNATLAALNEYNRRVWQNIPCLTAPGALADSVRVIMAEAEVDPRLNAEKDAQFSGRAQGSVHSMLVDATRASSVSPVDLIPPLLRSPASSGRDFGLSIAYDERAFATPEARTALLALLRSPDTETQHRLGVLSVFSNHAELGGVADDAHTLADTTRDPEVLWRAAGYFAAGQPTGGDIFTAFRESTGGVRQRLALYVLREREPAPLDQPYAPTARLLSPDSADFNSALRIAVTLAHDGDAPAHWRTDAVYALLQWREELIARDALIALLEPEAWYFDPSAYPFPQPSAAIVVSALRTDTSSVVQSALDRLRERTDEIPEGGDYVDWLLGK